MALYKPTIAGQLSGRIGGNIFSHNAGGQYVRVGTVPTNPNTPFQVVVRAAMSQLSAVWASVLTQIQRDSWELYAENVTVPNRLGDQINISGLSMYVRSNTSRLQAGITRIDTGPGVFNVGAFTAPTMSNASAATQLIDVAFGSSGLTDPWANEAGGFLFLYISRPQNPGINFFRGPYRFSGTVVGDPVPPVSPAQPTAPFVFIAGQRLFGRFFAVTADGRLAAETFATTVAVA